MAKALLAGRVALVTGAAGGIGLSIVDRFHSEGAIVIGVDSDSKGVEMASRTRDDGCHWIVADVSSDLPSDDYVSKAVERWGRVDVAVLNAGTFGTYGLFGDMPVEVFDRVIRVNLRGVWLGLSRLLPVMKAGGGGAITITSSTAGLRGTVGLAPYSASKHGVVGLMKSAALEGAAQNVRVNTVHPAGTNTRMLAAISVEAPKDDPKANSSAGSSSPLGRAAEPREVANLVTFLSSDEASYCSGGTYEVDGAALAGAPLRGTS